jgi:hypothetical protein
MEKKRKNSTLRANLLWRNYFILSLHPFALKSEHSVHPLSYFPIIERTSLSLSYELAFAGGLKWWRPSWKELGSLVSNHTDTEVCNVVTSVDQLLIEILLSHRIGIVQIYVLRTKQQYSIEKPQEKYSTP